MLRRYRLGEKTNGENGRGGVIPQGKDRRGRVVQCSLGVNEFGSGPTIIFKFKLELKVSRCYPK